MSLKVVNQSGVSLTSSEAVVLRLMANGLSCKEIGVELTVSPRTVNFHLGGVYRKLGARNRIDAIRLATRHGFVAWMQ